jgi:hypothetical protein
VLPNHKKKNLTCSDPERAIVRARTLNALNEEEETRERERGMRGVMKVGERSKRRKMRRWWGKEEGGCGIQEV